MGGFTKIHQLLLVGFFALSLSTEAKADGVSLTLTPSAYAVGNGLVRVTGFFTNSGTLTFRANRFDVFPPFVAGIAAVEENGTLTYTNPVPGMSSTPVIHLLNFLFVSPTPPGTYSFTVTFSGFDASGAQITTSPARLTVSVPEGFVPDPNIATPEPTTVILLTTGLTALGGSFLRRQNHAKR